MSVARMTSKSRFGVAFMWRTSMPSRTGSVHALTPGAPSTATRQFGHWPAQHMSPRRRGGLDEGGDVRRPAGAAREPARGGVFERAGERRAPGGVQRRADRVALVGLDGLAVEAEADRLRARDALAGLLGQAAHASVASPPVPDAATGVFGSASSGTSPGSAVQWTAFVRVSRWATNHARHPDRWNHHSRCTPATLRRT